MRKRRTRALPRRTFLQSLGVAATLPFLDGLDRSVHADPASARTNSADEVREAASAVPGGQAPLALDQVAVSSAGRTFIPDFTFEGSSLAGWHVLGQADWRAQNGELVGVAKPGGSGWLVLDRSYQDVGFYASVRCAGECKTGVLLRAEKTPQGIKGIFLAFEENAVVAYRVTLDAQGQELQREKLRSVNGMVRIAQPPAPAAANGAGGRGPSQPARPTVASPLYQIPSNALQSGDWNQLEIFLDANIVRWFVNDSTVQGGVAESDAGNYGPVALYVGGTGEVRFKNVSYKDIGLKVTDAEKVGSRFRMQRVSDFFYSWSVAAADFNRDGIMDITTGPYIYYGPDYTRSREVYLAQPYNPAREYPYTPSRQFPAHLPDSSWVVHAHDFTGDGWPDVLTTDHAGGTGAVLYVNPKGEGRRWDRFTVVPLIQSEITLLRDVDGDGQPELVYGAEGYVRYAKPDPNNPTGPWIIHSISEQGPWFTGPGTGGGHGIGVGDISGDGRMDIVTAWGWWEQPPAGSSQERWIYHPEAFGRWDRSNPGGATIGVYDVNGDGLNDIVTSLQAHGFGLAWFEQKRDASGKISFVRHMIMDNFSTKNAGGVTFTEMHGLTIGDVDGDGVPDVIVGKRYWSHEDDYYDPDPYGQAVLYWYKTVRNPKAPGGAEFVPHLIHNRSGVGSDVLAADLNNDGAVDIVTANNRGTFIFWNKPGNVKD
jgi:hypothetical protein